jgi:nitrogen fixation/metabolism regulation signal transduction histidine kinase
MAATGAGIGLPLKNATFLVITLMIPALVVSIFSEYILTLPLKHLFSENLGQCPWAAEDTSFGGCA